MVSILTGWTDNMDKTHRLTPDELVFGDERGDRKNLRVIRRDQKSVTDTQDLFERM